MPQISRESGNNDRLGFLSYRQATFFSGIFSVVFALLVFSHEVAIEGGFDIKNYVVIAFCFIWLIVDSLLLLGASKRAHFLFLPWMILICLLSPLFIVGIVVGVKVIDSCHKHHDREACDHQVHMFGSTNTTQAGAKLTLLIFMLIVNLFSMLVVYKYIMVLSGKSPSVIRQTQGFIYSKNRDGESKTLHNKKYSRFLDDNEPETNVPLCHDPDDMMETNT
ncbi:hypothetical protein LSH36_1012g00026 [Paralvinella palmiformis]|uniref:Uncharacterized protein n=1 Tax=Paralvinella palmiformis TaxID=53620 RepID=A0AAD9IVX9_9ANNE|nr:hypothetical protein LSH36_1012g00026 [Paralvinella palmiformis]